MFGISLPSPSSVIDVITSPPKPPFVPAPLQSVTDKVLGVAEKAQKFITAPIKSTIAADPLLSWAETGRWSSHSARTKAGVHELYKEDRLAQRLGVREKDVVTVVHIATVVVACYFGGSFLAGSGSTSGAAAAGSAGAGSGGAAATAAGITGTLSTAGEVVGAVGAVAGMVPPQGVQDQAPVVPPENQQKKGGTAAVLGLLAVGALLFMKG